MNNINNSNNKNAGSRPNLLFVLFLRPVNHEQKSINNEMMKYAYTSVIKKLCSKIEHASLNFHISASAAGNLRAHWINKHLIVWIATPDLQIQLLFGQKLLPLPQVEQLLYSINWMSCVQMRRNRAIGLIGINNQTISIRARRKRCSNQSQCLNEV